MIAQSERRVGVRPHAARSIDPETGDVVHNIYVRRVEKKGGEFDNVEFSTFEAVKDPGKAAKTVQ